MTHQKCMIALVFFGCRTHGLVFKNHTTLKKDSEQVLFLLSIYMVTGGFKFHGWGAKKTSEAFPYMSILKGYLDQNTTIAFRKLSCTGLGSVEYLNQIPK
jgi:hypothetical protein